MAEVAYARRPNDSPESGVLSFRSPVAARRRAHRQQNCLAPALVSAWSSINDSIGSSIKGVSFLPSLLLAASSCVWELEG
jgi:hypothetical protein